MVNICKRHVSLKGNACRLYMKKKSKMHGKHVSKKKKSLSQYPPLWLKSLTSMSFQTVRHSMSWSSLIAMITYVLWTFIIFVTNSSFLQHVFTMPFTSLFHLRTTCIFLKADMPLYTYMPHFHLMFYMCLPQGEHQFFTYLKPVVRRLYSLAFH